MRKRYEDPNQLTIEEFFKDFFDGVADAPAEEPLPPRRKKIANEFGQKIGGSRRDMWAKSVNVHDLPEMSDAEKVAFIKKDAVWPKPNYEAMLSEGREKSVVYYIKHIRDAIAPDIDSAKKAELYVEAMNKLKDSLLEKVYKEEDIRAFYRNFISNEYWVTGSNKKRRVEYLSVTEAFRVLNCSRVLKALQLTPANARYAAAKKGFLMSDDERMLWNINYFVVACDNIREMDVSKSHWIKYGASGNHVYVRNLDSGYIKEIRDAHGKYVLILDEMYMGIYDTEEKAKAYVLSTRKADPNETEKAQPVRRKKSFCYAKLESLVHHTGDDYLSDFGFRGGEFGNWVSNSERQINLDRGYTALRNLADALGIEPSDISLGGKLGIAFGARGKGGKAVAHYDPVYKCINLSKFSGAGSLAHEFAHSLDFVLGEQIGGMNRSFMQMWDDRWHGRLKSVCPEAYDVCRAMFYRENGYTEFYINSKKMGGIYAKDSGYWDCAVEMFARAFAAFCADRVKDDYLCGHSESAVGIDENGERFSAVPNGEERRIINSAIERLVNALFKKKAEEKTA